MGAHYGSAADGSRYVFKWYEGDDRYERIRPGLDRVEQLRRLGYPAPAHLPAFRIAGGVVVVQEAVEGAASDEVSVGLVQRLLALNDLQSGLHEGGGTAWTDRIRSTLLEGADGYCLHRPLRDHDAETRMLLGWIEEVGRDHGDLPADDIAHFDFHHRNMLRVDGRLTAVVDWDGSSYGDRAFDLVTFCFGFSHAVAEPGSEELLWSRACELASADVLSAYVAHMALRRVDWTIRHNPEEIDLLMPVLRRYRALVEGG